MKDITKYIRESASQSIIWSFGVLFDVIEHMRIIGYDISFWEEEENWVVLYRENEIVAYLWRKYPLIFINYRYSIVIQEALREYNFITIIEVDDFTDKNLKMDYDGVKEVLDYRSISDFFSVEDLWFHTNIQ
ncbi:MAG: hypothetical protein ABIN80_26665 [Dyadobacter sp.]|uniref:hypothetical protein n=1 Tax=Dyadobacter sp. TaxID=1914288 RepID=UPI003264D2BC